MKTLHKILVLGIFAMVFGTCAIAQATDERGYKLSIAPQPLDTALTDLANQSGIQLAFYPPDCEGLLAPRLEGRYTLRAALEHLLANTPLRYELVNERMVAIRLKGTKTSSSHAEDAGQRLNKVRVADLTSGSALPERDSTQANGEPNDDGTPSAKDNGRSSHNEMTVTGTQIRGVAPVGSQVMVFTQEDFDRAGAATPQQFLSSLTQNFGGDYSDDTYTVATGNLSNGKNDIGKGSGVNLRGLGSGATLVLINGHRVATSGQAVYTDVSMIPLSAVERIEVVADSQSAIYGSDAVGGVVNIILKSDHDAAQTKLLTGLSSQEDAEELQLAQSVGKGWRSGSALLSYEYYYRGAVSSLDRDFSENSGFPYDLIPEQRRRSFVLTAQQALTNRVNSHATALYSSRDSAIRSFDTFTLEDFPDSLFESTQASGALGFDIQLWSSWLLSLNADISRTKISAPSQNYTSTDSRKSFDAVATGSVFTLPAGPVHMAIGAGYYDDDVELVSGATIVPKESLDHVAMFSELVLPVLNGKQESGNKKNRLTFSLAARYEDHSDFGETFDPKFGVEWLPATDLRIRGSYGTSFKAPSLHQLNEYNATYQIATFSGISGLRMLGNNSTLHEETGASLSVGAEFTPRAFSGFSMQVNYYDTKYEQRIGVPSSTPSNTLLERLRAAGLAVQRGDIPDAEFNAVVQERLNATSARWIGCSQLSSAGSCLTPVSSINALLDARITNLAETRTRGVDLTANQHFDIRSGNLDIEANATYIIDYQQRIAKGTSLVELVDTPYKPLNLRLRTSLTWSRDNLAVSGFVNYSDRYSNINASPETKVSSWTTIDLNARYDIKREGWLRGTSFLLSIKNLFDADPPTMIDPAIFLTQPRLNYDQANADPLGRVYSLALTKQW